jgi:hypothetical protein
MPVVASEPLPTNAKLHIQVDELHLEVSMVEWGTSPVSPLLAAPSKDETSHPMNQKFGIGARLNPEIAVCDDLASEPSTKLPMC